MPVFFSISQSAGQPARPPPPLLPTPPGADPRFVHVSPARPITNPPPHPPPVTPPSPTLRTETGHCKESYKHRAQPISFLNFSPSPCHSGPAAQTPPCGIRLTPAPMVFKCISLACNETLILPACPTITISPLIKPFPGWQVLVASFQKSSTPEAL
jgi:hypothetical protein